jgi:hypothetical protein
MSESFSRRRFPRTVLAAGGPRPDCFRRRQCGTMAVALSQSLPHGHGIMTEFRYQGIIF